MRFLTHHLFAYLPTASGTVAKAIDPRVSEYMRVVGHAGWGWEEMPAKEQKGWRTFYNTASNRGSVQPSAERERGTGAKTKDGNRKKEDLRQERIFCFVTAVV